MTDARLRGHERTAGDDVAARARLLVERGRAGQLPPGGLRLAAGLGDPAARLALGPDAPPPGEVTPPLRALCEAVVAAGAEATVRGALAVGWTAVGRWERARGLDQERRGLARQALDALEQAVRTPAALSSAQALADRCLRSDRPVGADLLPAAEAIHRAAILVGGCLVRPQLEPGVWEQLAELVAAAEGADGDPGVVQGLVAEVVLWATGEGDPVAARRAGRTPDSGTI